MPIWWLCFTLYESGWYKIVSPTHALSIHDIKIESYGLVLELFWFQKWHVFAHFCIILPIAARADFELWRARTALWKIKSDCKQMEIVNCRIRNPNHVNILNFCHWFALRARTTPVRTRTDGKFWNAVNDLVRMQNCLQVILSISKFWRARTCASWRTRAQGLSVCWVITWSLCVLNLINLS